jgi:hypothetical protein
MNSHAQVSVESILLWAGMAAALAFITPVAVNTMESQTVLFQARELQAAANTIQFQLEELVFSSSGSQATISIPSFENVIWKVNDFSIQIELHSDFLSSPKLFVAASPLPLQGTVTNDQNVVLKRTSFGITIE